MSKYRNINYSVFPKFISDFLHYRLYVENLSEFTVYGEAEKLKSFLKYVLCLKSKLSLTEYKNLHDYTSIKPYDLKHFSLSSMLNYIEFITNTLKYEAQTRANVVLTVKTLYRYMKKMDYIKENPFEDLAVPKYRLKTVVYMSELECKQFLNVIDNVRDKAIIYLLLNTGARRFEVANARLDNLNLSNRTLLVIGKGDKERFLYLNDLVVSSLNEYLKTRSDNCEFLFTSVNNNKLDYNDIYRIVKKYLAKAGLDVHKYSTHKLRHTFATLLYQHGTDLRLLQELLGHSNLETTMRYTHLQNCILHETVENFILNSKK